jgi:hypothetical protein
MQEDLDFPDQIALSSGGIGSEFSRLSLLGAAVAQLV